MVTARFRLTVLISLSFLFPSTFLELSRFYSLISHFFLAFTPIVPLKMLSSFPTLFSCVPCIDGHHHPGVHIIGLS